MNEITIFENPEFGSVRTITIDGEPWLIGKDVAKILGYANTRKALLDHVDSEDKNDGVTIRDSIGRMQNPVFINESGFYSLVLSSKLPAAKKFKRWVTSEVLPAIRKNGAYIAEEKLRESNALLEERVASLESKAEYYDTIINSRKLITVSEIAYEYGIPAVNFNQLLFKLGIQFRIDNTWYLTEEYAGNDYVRTDMRRYFDYRSNTYKSYIHTRWTQKGVEFLYRLLGSIGIHPIRNDTDINIIQFS